MSDSVFLRLVPLAVIFLSVGGAAFVLLEQGRATWARLSAKGIQSISPEVIELELDRSPTFYFFLRVVIAITAFLLGMFAINIFFGALLAWLGYLVPAILLKRKRDKRRQLLTSQLLEGLELMGNALKSGLTLTQAFELLVREYPPPIATEFGQVLAENRLGVDLRDGLNALAARLKLPVITILATGVTVTVRCGGDLTEIFQHIAETIRARAGIEGKIEAVSSLGKFQALILSAMPFLLMILLFFLDRQHVESLFETKIGLAAVGIMVTLVVVANVWINKLLKIDV